MNRLLLTLVTTITLASVGNAKDGDLLESLSKFCTASSADYLHGGGITVPPFTARLQNFQAANNFKDANDFVKSFLRTELRGNFFTDDFDKFFEDLCAFVNEGPSFLKSTFSNDIDSNCDIIDVRILPIFQDIPGSLTDLQIAKIALFGKHMEYCRAGVKKENYRSIINRCNLDEDLYLIRDKKKIIQKLLDLGKNDIVFHAPVNNVIDKIICK